MLIKKSAIVDYLGRPFDDHRWVKTLDRDTLLREVRAMKVRPIFKTQSWLHQLACFYIGLHYPRFLFLLDMGLGKSKIMLDLITQVQREKKLQRALIFVPRTINIDSWRDDILRHSELEPWGIDIPDTDEKWERLRNPQGEVTIIDYMGMHLALCKKEKTKKGNRLVRDEKRVREIRKIYNWICLDESHKLRSHDNLWYSLMNQITKTVDYCYGSTGTLFGSRQEDIWSQFKLVDRGETFGENLGLFRASLFHTKTTAFKVEYVFDKNQEKMLNRMLQHRSLRYDENEVLDLPERVPRTYVVEMTKEQREHYLLALEGMINCGGKVAEMDGQWIKMRQIMSGYLSWKDDHGDHVLHFKVNPKLDAVESLIDGMGDSKIIVVYMYTETGRAIVERVKKMGLGVEWFYGGTKDKSASRRRFMDDPRCRVMVMQADAGGTGNDGLQKVARYMVMYETPTSPTERKQVIKRIHRPGQKKRVFIYDLIMHQSLDRGFLRDLTEGINTYDRVINGKFKRTLFLT